MSWLIAAGNALQSVGGSWQDHLRRKEDLSRQDEDRDFARQMAMENLALQSRAQEEARRRQDLIEGRYKRDDDRAAAMSLIQNLPGAEVGEDVVETIDPVWRPIVFDRQPPRTGQPPPEGLLGPSNWEFPGSTKVREFTSPSERRGAASDATRMEIARLQDDALNRRLATQRDIAEASNVLGRDRLNALIRQHNQRMGLDWEALATRVDLANRDAEADRMMDIALAEFRAAAAQRGTGLVDYLINEQRRQQGLPPLPAGQGTGVPDFKWPEPPPPVTRPGGPRPSTSPPATQPSPGEKGALDRILRPGGR